MKDDSEPVVEVTISPLEMSMPSKRTEETVTETTSTRFNRNTSVTLSNRSERSELSFRSPDYADGRPESPSGSSGISDRRYEVIITTGTPKESERVEEPPPMPQPYAAKGDGRYDDGRYVDETVTRTTTTYSTESSREDRKTPTDRPPAYGAGYAVAGGAVASDDATGGEDYVTEEIVTTTTSPGVERTFDDDDVKKISLSYDGMIS